MLAPLRVTTAWRTQSSLPWTCVVGVDIGLRALEASARNAVTNGVAGKVGCNSGSDARGLVVNGDGGQRGLDGHNAAHRYLPTGGHSGQAAGCLHDADTMTGTAPIQQKRGAQNAHADRNAQCICVILDAGYIAHTAARLASIAAHSQGLSLVLVGRNLAREDIARMLAFAQEIGFDAEFVDASARDLGPLAAHGDWSQTVWLKLHLDRLVPGRYSRVLYLDGDMIATGDVARLFSLDLAGKALAAVPDIPKTAANRKPSLGIAEDGIYFNSGLLLIDMAVWRSLGLGRRAVAYAEKHHGDLDRMMNVDQCALNAACWRHVLPLGREWNLMIYFLNPAEGYVLRRPCIIHFAGPKPWDNPGVAGAEHYFRHLATTPWPAGIGLWKTRASLEHARQAFKLAAYRLASAAGSRRHEAKYRRTRWAIRMTRYFRALDARLAQQFTR